MPVFAEQKENSTSALDRVVEPSLEAGLNNTHNLKDDSSSSPNTSSSVQEVEARMNNNQQQEQLQLQQEQEQQSSSSSPSQQPQLSPAEQTMIFFDWDDTLLSSTFLASNGYRLDTDMESKDSYEYIQAELKQLEICVNNVLTEALQRGRVHIITNAEHGWVELSAQKFIPAVLPLLSKITIISARTTYEHLYPESPLKWKFSAFQERLSPFFALPINRNILSFGDSHVEREAVRTVTRGVENTRTKSIKFTESPTMDQLRKQLELVASHFHYIFTHEGDLDLMLKMSPVNGTEAPTA